MGSSFTELWCHCSDHQGAQCFSSQSSGQLLFSSLYYLQLAWDGFSVPGSFPAVTLS